MNGVFDLDGGMLGDPSILNLDEPGMLFGMPPGGGSPPAPAGYTAKSVFLDINDNQGDPDYVGLRSIDFYKGTVKVEVTLDDIDSTFGPALDGDDFNISNIFITGLSKIGDDNFNGWEMNDPYEVRIGIVFKNPIQFDSVVVNNFHQNGDERVIRGANNVKMYTSVDSITNPTYRLPVNNSFLIFDGQFKEHVAQDIEDPQILELLYNPIIVMPSFVGTAKSVILDIADNWGDGVGKGIRSVDFYFDANKLNIEGDNITCYATSEASSSLFKADYTFITNLTKIGQAPNTQWVGTLSGTAKQRLICIFNNAITFDSIVINNSHDSGGLTDRGVKNVKIHTSIDAIIDTTYDAVIPNSTKIYDSVFRQHIAEDIEDPQTLWLVAA